METDKKINLLIVDDSPSKLLAMSAALADLDQNIVTALSGREALRLLLNQEFAVILLDVNMPDLDGFETASLIRARQSTAHTPIIFVTAYGDDAYAARGYSLGAVDYLLAPVAPEALRAKVSVFVDLYKKNLQIQAQAEERIALAQEQAARRTAEAANRMKDEFLATLSHELRTPLNSILGWVHLLKSPDTTEADRAVGLDVIERNARLQATIIEDLLDVSRIISGKLELEMSWSHVVDIVEAAISTVRLNLDAKSIDLACEFESEIPPLEIDPARLQQVVSNILSNAVKFTPPGGRITVTVRRTADTVEIQVTDTGEGIPPEFLPYVFERFRQADASTTRRHGGLGIGLAICRQLIEMHGGRIEVTSAGAGCGATFTVYLPLKAHADANVAKSEADADEDTLANRPSLHGLTILIVDDDDDARTTTARILSDQGAVVIEAASAANAIVLLSRQAPDLLISDIGMPQRDGFELIRDVRVLADGDTLPAIALTAYARPEDRGAAIDAGFQMHLAKPVDPIDLIQTISKLMARKAANRNHRPHLPRTPNSRGAAINIEPSSINGAAVNNRQPRLS